MESLTESTNAADGQKLRHLFHRRCLEGWINNTCPNCRDPMNIKPVKVVIRSHKGGKNKKSKKNKKMKRQRKKRTQKKQR